MEKKHLSNKLLQIVEKYNFSNFKLISLNPFVIERFKRDETKCMPACNSFQFHMENLHYLSENTDYQKQLRKQLHLNDDIAMHSAIIHLAENANVIQEETSTYPWTAFLSDTGGALGKVLC